jgi:hypothetical protein
VVTFQVQCSCASKFNTSYWFWINMRTKFSVGLQPRWEIGTAICSCWIETTIQVERVLSFAKMYNTYYNLPSLVRYMICWLWCRSHIARDFLTKALILVRAIQFSMVKIDIFWRWSIFLFQGFTTSFREIARWSSSKTCTQQQRLGRWRGQFDAGSSVTTRVNPGWVVLRNSIYRDFLMGSADVWYFRTR